MVNYLINELHIDNLDRALHLIWNVFTKYDAPDYSQEGIEKFQEIINKNAVEKKLISGEVNIIACWDNTDLIGVLAIKRPCHIWLMFVDGDYHQKGIAKNMFKEFLKDFKGDKITVNSSPYAIEFYKRLGFEAEKDEQLIHGIRFIPMVKMINS